MTIESPMNTSAWSMSPSGRTSLNFRLLAATEDFGEELDEARYAADEEVRVDAVIPGASKSPSGCALLDICP
jgi:hypothetical protein